MPILNLTDTVLKSLNPPETGQITYWDENIKGFGVRVSSGGAKSFVLVHGVNRQRETLGRYPTISLKQGRDKAKKLIAEITLGIDQRHTISFKDAHELFLEHCQSKNKKNTVDYYRKRLGAHFRFGRKRLDEISRLDVQNRIGKIKTSQSEQHHAFVVARTFFNWAVREQYLSSSPIANMKPPPKSATRERVLSDHELIEVLQKAEIEPYPFGEIVILLLLSGMRRNEVVNLKWDWIDRNEQLISLPSTLTKNNRPHTMPYGERIASVIDRVPQWGENLFPSQSAKGKVFNGWGKAKARFDNTLEGVEPYTLHDLRRTFATVHACVGTPIHVTEKLLNHVSGTISGVAAVYNRHSYMKEMRVAMEEYDKFLDELLNS